MRVKILRASNCLRTSDLRRFVYVGILAMLGACSRHDSPNTEVAQSAPNKREAAQKDDSTTVGETSEAGSVSSTKPEADLAMERIEEAAHAQHRDWFEVKIGKLDGECESTGSHSARADADLVHPENTHLTQAVKNGDDYVIVYDTYRGQKVYATSRHECQNVIDANVAQASTAPK